MDRGNILFLRVVYKILFLAASFLFRPVKGIYVSFCLCLGEDSITDKAPHHLCVTLSKPLNASGLHFQDEGP